MDFFIPSGTSKGNEKGNLKWWQLSLVGVGCTIGTGFFLGSAIGIETPVLLSSFRFFWQLLELTLCMIY